jgi:hypothetical protein
MGYQWHAELTKGIRGGSDVAVEGRATGYARHVAKKETVLVLVTMTYKGC